jgi:formate C-acetyltransferase
MESMNDMVRHWRTAKLNDELLAVKPEICAERARLVTRSYKETEGEPMVIRRAKAIAKVFREMTIFIQRDQLIAGTQASKLRFSPVFPETEAVYLEKEIDLFEKREQDRLIVRPEVKKELLEEILPYWMDKNTQVQCLRAMPEDLRNIIHLEDQIFSVDIHITGSIGHVIVDYDKVLTKGVLGLKKEVNEKLEKLNLTVPGEIEKYNFYQAELILCDAITDWAKRYGDKARELAATEEDPRWKKELLLIAEICDRVPAYPAQNFREAVQSFWFTHLPLYIEHNGLAVSCGRLDQ